MKHYFLFFLFFCFINIRNAGAAEIRVGVASVAIQLPKKVSMAGYFQRRLLLPQRRSHSHLFKASKKIHDPLKAKAIAINDGLKSIYLVSLDTVAIDPKIKMAVLDRLNAEIGPDDEIQLIATHTHSSVGGFSENKFWENLALDEFNKEIFNSMVDAIASAVYKAKKNLIPAHIEIGHGQIDQVTFNRRKNPFLDPELNLIKFIAQSGDVIATLLNFPIHGTVMDSENLELSGDIPSAFEQEFEKLTDVPAYFFSAAAGDVGPLVTQSSFLDLKKLSQKLAKSALKMYSKTTPIRIQDFSMSSISYELPKPYINITACMDLFLPEFLSKFLRIINSIPLPSDFKLPLKLTALNLGTMTFIFVPGEPTAELGSMVKKIADKHNIQRPIIFSLANAYQGYILTRNEYLKGGYESCNSFYGPDYDKNFIAAIAQLFGSIKAAR